MQVNRWATLVAMGVSSNLFAATTMFQFYPGTGSALNDAGVNLARASTVLIFVDDSPGTWDPTWTDITDGNQYGGNGDTFWFATNTSSTGTYRTPTFTDASGPHIGDQIYAVVLQWNFTNQFYVSGTLHGVDDGTHYAIVPGTYALVDSPTLPQQFSGGNIQTSSHISVVPEPTTFALLATGMGVLLMRRRKKQTAESEQSA